MGYDASAHMVIGFKVKRSDCNVEEKSRGCRCNLSNEELNYKFCPKCGKPVVKVSTECILNDLEENDDFPFEIMQLHDSNEAYIGEFHDFIPMSEIHDIDYESFADEMKSELEKYGIRVKDSDFGIHSFLYESY